MNRAAAAIARPAPVSVEEFVRGSSWAGELPSGELERVCEETRERGVPAGGYAVRTATPATCWIGVIEGLVKLNLSSPDGRESTVTAVSAGGWFGEGTLMKAKVWRYDVVASRDSRIACVPLATFERLLHTHIGFNHFLLGQLNARLSLMISLVGFDRLLGADTRVARCLASLFDTALYPRTGLFIELNQNEIGSLAALSRQRTNQALQALEKAGLLRIEFCGITVLDLPGLQHYQGESESRQVLKLRNPAH